MQSEAVLVSDEAKVHLEKSLRRHDGASCFLLDLKPDGCSGYQFKLTPASEIPENYITVSSILHVPKKLMVSIYGLKISLEPQGNFGYKIKYELPNATNYCGCGKSFQLDAQGEIK